MLLKKYRGFLRIIVTKLTQISLNSQRKGFKEIELKVTEAIHGRSGDPLFQEIKFYLEQELERSLAQLEVAEYKNLRTILQDRVDFFSTQLTRINTRAIQEEAFHITCP
jgi:hypothetical protein